MDLPTLPDPAPVPTSPSTRRTSTGSLSASSKPASSKPATSQPDTDESPLTSETARLDDDPGPQRRIHLDLSFAQVAGGSAAAATAAALSSQLGVAGTIAGAAVISMVTAVAGSVYTQSLRRTRDRVQAVAVRRTLVERTSGRSDVAEALDPPVRIERRPSSRPERTRAQAGSRPTARFALRPRRLIAGAVAVFALALAGITGFEVLTGHPLSGGTGTTLGEVANGGSGTGSEGTEQAPVTDQDQPDDAAPTDVPTEDSESRSTQPTGPATSEPSAEPSDRSEPGESSDPQPSPDPTPTTATSPTGVGGPR